MLHAPVPQGKCTDLAISRDKRLAGAIYGYQILVWETDTGKELLDFRARKGSDPRRIALDGVARRVLISQTWEPTITVLDLKGSVLGEFFGHVGHQGGGTGQMIVAENGGVAASVGSDNFLKIWSMHTFELLAETPATDAYVLAFDSRDQLLAVGGGQSPYAVNLRPRKNVLLFRTDLE
jgi:hypothetical protein